MADRKAIDHAQYLKRKARRRLKTLSTILVCAECGTDFHPKRTTAEKFCGESCRENARIKTLREFRSKPEEIQKRREYANRRWQELRKDPSVRALISHKQNDRWHRRQSILRAARIFVCKQCGKAFHPEIGRQKFCTKECWAESQRATDCRVRKTPEYRARRNAFLKEKRKDPGFKLRTMVSKTIWRALRKQQSHKSCSVVKALPYSIPQLKAHLESQFDNVNGFTWENYGTIWNVDHIIPQAMFPYTEMESKTFRDCWALSNLRPLRAIENIKKGAKVSYGT